MRHGGSGQSPGGILPTQNATTWQIVMRAIFIAYDKAHHELIIDLLSRHNCRGFTAFGTVQGRGTKTGEPHLGTHAWPSLAGAILTIVEDHRADAVMNALHELDETKPKLGLRAFQWPIERTI